jgi:acetyl esterase/lipase
MNPKFSKVVALSLALASEARAEPEQPAVPFAALYSSITAERNVDVESGIAYGSLSRQKLDIYEPRAGVTKQKPIVVFYYGGSWESGDRAIYGFAGAAFASRGFTTVIPDYRVYPEVRFPAFVEDAAAAYAWVAKNLSAACGEARPIIIAGHSAGAHIAALLALDPHYLAAADAGKKRPAGWIGLAGPYAFDPTTWPSTKAIFDTTASNPDAARPISFARAGTPPALLIHGAADDVVKPEASRQLFDALKARGASAQKIEYDGVGHVGLVLTYSKPFRWRADTLDSTIEFIQSVGGSQAGAECVPKAGAR